jgi:hypothetical protein
MTYWLVITTDTQKERHVARLVENLGYATFIPMAVSLKTVSRRTRKRAMNEVVLYPRAVFVLAPSTWNPEDVNHARGWLRDAQGFTCRIPPSQMARFQERHYDWLEGLKKQFRRDRGDRTIKARFTRMTIEALADMKAALFAGDRADISPSGSGSVC